jgi:hypothetical protein
VSLLVSPTDDAEIGTEARFGSIEIRNFQTASRMTNQWPGIKGVTPVRRPDAVAKWTRQAGPPSSAGQKRESYLEFYTWRARSKEMLD